VASRAYRGPSSDFGRDSGDFHVVLSPSYEGEAEQSAVSLKCTIPSGKGHSDIIMRISPESFAKLAQSMVDVNAAAAIKAFGAAMVQGSRARDEQALWASLTDGAAKSE